MTTRRTTPLVLAVDDEPANLALLRKLVKHFGYDYVEATDGISALAAVRKQQPDIVLLDVMMPGLDGFEVCRRLREQPEHVMLPVLLLTSLTRPEDKATGLESGANDFLAKPFEDIELHARLRSLLRTKALQDRLADILGRYVSDSVATAILRDPVGGMRLGGDRRRVTSVFADLRGYTTLAAEHPPEVTIDLLNRYLSAATDVVFAREGTVLDLLGDGVIAVFGAPTAHEDDGWRAVESALLIQAKVRELEIPNLPGVQLQTGIGVTTGDVIAGNVGSERRMHYTVVGDPVNVAARLQAAAGPGQILIDEETYRLVRDHVIAQDLGTLRVAGKIEWLHVYNVVALGPVAPLATVGGSA